MKWYNSPRYGTRKHYRYVNIAEINEPNMSIYEWTYTVGNLERGKIVDVGLIRDHDHNVLDRQAHRFH